MTGRTILLIEDSPDDEALILRALKKASVQNRIDVVRDGAEALEYVFGRGRYAGRAVAHPTITILDLKLPKVDGLEVLRQIREDSRTKHNPVVILTSSDEHEDLLRSYGLGANSYVRKPIEFGQFSKTVADLGLYWLLLNRVAPDAQ
ncbi:MAG: response regulator [Aliidongia sp.]|jgi:CheY-like chemotaxis protein